MLINGIEVAVHGDDGPFEEHVDSAIVEDDVSRQTVWIEAKTGENFHIHMATPPEDLFEGDLMAYDIKPDGRLVDTPLIQKGSPLDEEVSYGLILPDQNVRPFRFTGLAIEEYRPASKAKDEDRKRYKDVGKIVIEVHNKNQGKEGTLYVDPNGWKEIDTVDEKTLKGRSVSHSVGLAPPVANGEGSVFLETSFVDPDRVPARVFTFLYCSAEKLRSVFPATPTPSPEPEEAVEDAAPDNGLDEKIAEAKRRVADLERQRRQPTLETIRGIKREHNENEAEDGPLRRARRAKTSEYLELGDDGFFKEVEAPVRPSRPATQID